MARQGRKTYTAIVRARFRRPKDSKKTDLILFANPKGPLFNNSTRDHDWIPYTGPIKNQRHLNSGAEIKFTARPTSYRFKEKGKRPPRGYQGYDIQLTAVRDIQIIKNGSGSNIFMAYDNWVAIGRPKY